MAEIKKKVITTTNKGLLVLLGLSIIIILILFLSGFNKINPYLLLFAFAIAGAFVFYFLRKPKQMDLPEMVNYVANRWYEKTKMPLDTTDFQAIPVTSEVTEIYFPNEPATIQVEGKKITGLERRHLLSVVKSREKSNLFREGIKYIGAESKIKQRAEELNVDVESLGLE